MSDSELKCDIVMKGGITSGIVYPGVVGVLSKTFRFVSIGGTSAGAIAAGATAAAEFGRLTRKVPDAFDQLDQLPIELGKPADGGIPKLLSLFRPESGLKALFHTMLAGTDGFSAAFGEAVCRYWAPAFIAALVPFILGFMCFLQRSWLGGAAWILLAGLAALVSMAGVIVTRDLLKRVPANGFGLCSGMDEEGKALTPWLHALFQRLSGLGTTKILTFGDLQAQDIELKMMTTNVTQGRPIRLPVEEKTFFFRRDDMRKLFPADVVEHLVTHARKEDEENRTDEFIPFPAPENLPVIVAARMSLSFPLLFSAVPLYAVDYEQPLDTSPPEAPPDILAVPEISAEDTHEERPADGEGAQPPAPGKSKRPLERCWFSDGGISSNFPVHFFDSPLPSWPTFAINLRYLPGEVTTPYKARMIRHNSQGLHEPWNRFDKKGLPGFISAVICSMQNWQDNAQMRLPGYRDRVVHIGLSPSEGGLNLNMPKELIEELSKRGQMAGALLSRRFTPGSGEPFNWENHRWIRLRSLMSVLEGFLGNLSEQLDPLGSTPQTRPPYPQLSLEPPPQLSLDERPPKAARDRSHARPVSGGGRLRWRHAQPAEPGAEAYSRAAHPPPGMR